MSSFRNLFLVSTAAIILFLTISSSLHLDAATTLHTCGSGASYANTSSISNWCPQYNKMTSCCTQDSLNSYFNKAIKVCGQEILHEDDGCAVEMRGMLCFGLCATDNTTAAYSNAKGEMRICHNFANNAYSACRGRLFCPLKTPSGADNSNAKCHTDTNSKAGCYNIGEYYSSAEKFINAKVNGFFGVDEDTNTGVSYKNAQEYVVNDDETDTSFKISKPAGTCFSGASAVSGSALVMASILLVAMVISL